MSQDTENTLCPNLCLLSLSLCVQGHLPPQVVFCFLQILLEFLISKHENIFLLHALIRSTNSGVLSMVFYYMLLLFQKLVLISINNFAVFKIPKQENKKMYVLRD